MDANSARADYFRMFAEVFGAVLLAMSAIFCVGLLWFWLSNWIYFPRTFLSADWKAHDSRYEMHEDLLKRYQLEGMSEQQLVSLLGEYDYSYSPLNSKKKIGLYQMYRGNEGYDLEVQFSDRGSVDKYSVYPWSD